MGKKVREGFIANLKVRLGDICGDVAAPALLAAALHPTYGCGEQLNAVIMNTHKRAKDVYKSLAGCGSNGI